MYTIIRADEIELVIVDFVVLVIVNIVVAYNVSLCVCVMNLIHCECRWSISDHGWISYPQIWRLLRSWLLVITMPANCITKRSIQRRNTGYTTCRDR